MNKTEMIGAAAVIAVLVVGYLIYDGIQTKKGQNSNEFKKMVEIAKKLIPNCEQYTVAYSHSQTVDARKFGQTSTTTRHYYSIVAFKPDELYTIPISFAGKDIAYQKCQLLTKENIGDIQEKGDHGNLGYTLFDKSHNIVCELTVRASNTKLDKFDCVNIQQKAEAEAFKSFIAAFQAEIAGMNA